MAKSDSHYPTHTTKIPLSGTTVRDGRNESRPYNATKKQ